MFIDAYNTFEPKGGALSTISAAGTSTNIIDLGVTNSAAGGSQGRDLGLGTNQNGPFLVVALNSVTTSATNTTLQFALQGAPDNGSGSPGTWTTYVLSPAYTATELAATFGEQYFFPIVVPPRPPGIAAPRFLQLTYATANGSITAGTIYAGLTIGRDDNTDYQSNFTPPPVSGAGS